MRNPLSAIVQCADEISTSLSEYRAKTKQNSVPLELLDSNIDAAQTIALCANHQTRIVTDILTLSKLDSALLLVTPVDTKPLSVVQQNVKMFQGELQTADISLRVETDPSWEQLGIDWVKLDPSRLLQVLINLTTNAIKFTTGQPKRNITITLSAFSERPPRKFNPLVSYIPARPKRQESTEGADWGTGQEVFVHFAVTDTGRGLNDSEKKSLFVRFSQANPRTHVQYGGSGLGLFISRELVELQGGEIGVSSESGKGSTFAFYVKARKSSEPKEEPEQPTNAIGSVPTTLPSGATVMTSPGHQSATAADIGLMPTKPSNGELRVLIVEDNLVNQSTYLGFHQILSTC
jgi:signal transduction histidine kinase